MAKLFIEHLRLEGKRVLMRVDFNVPRSRTADQDDTRIARRAAHHPLRRSTGARAWC